MLVLYRLGSTCNHVLALLFKIDYAWQHGLTAGCAKPCTAAPNEWIRPTLTSLQPLRSADMLIVKPKLRAAAIRKLPAKEAHAARQLFNTERSKSDMEAFTLADITDAVYPECSSGVVFRYSHEGVETQYEPYDDINVGMTVKCQSTECDKRLMFVSLLEIGKSCSRPEDFTLPVYSDADREDIQLQTRGQADNRLWYLMREGRISASIAHDVYTKAVKFMAGDSSSCLRLVDLVLRRTTINPELPALKYGRAMETEAVETYYVVQFTDHENLKVDSCGLFIDATLSFLCASPDRLVQCSCCGSGIVEVKCPLKSADKKPTDAALPYLRTLDNKVTLSRSHKYYTQIQCQLAVSVRQWCDFFVYSQCGYHLERICFDKVFWQSRQQMLEKCFNSVVIPHLVGNK